MSPETHTQCGDVGIELTTNGMEEHTKYIEKVQTNGKSSSK